MEWTARNRLFEKIPTADEDPAVIQARGNRDKELEDAEGDFRKVLEVPIRKSCGSL